MFYIRVDANKAIATGHVMRCMAIAKQMEVLGEPCTFIAADENARELIEENGFQFVCLNTKWDELDEEIDTLLSMIHKKNIKVLLVDSYSVTKDYLEKINHSTKLVYIDDINRFSYPVHTVINYGIHYKEFNYEIEDNNRSNSKQYLLGCDYIPLREEFKKRVTPKRDKITNLLITTGGTDPYNMAGNLIKFLDTSKYQLHIVSGKLNTHYNELISLAKENENVFVYTNVKNMSDLMLLSDIAISAAGTTIYELCACGVPTISFSFADNQVKGAKELGKRKIVDYAGDLRNGIESCLKNIESMLCNLEQNKVLRDEISDRMQAFVDGNGAMRIASYCYKLQREEES